jgi:hypothetical protein
MRGLLGNALFCALALGLAAWAWRAPAPATGGRGDAVVLQCSAAELASLRYRAGAKTVDVAFSDEGQTGWIEVNQPVANAAAMAGQATPTEVRAFAASDRIARVVEAVAPLRALRSLGKLEEAKLALLGLVATPAKSPDALTVVCAGKTASFAIGEATYGGKGRAVRDATSGEVFLVGEAALGDVRMADLRFMQRSLLPAASEKLEFATISALGGQRRLQHRKRHSAGQDDWIDTTAPETRNEMFGNWIAQLLHLRLIDYLPPNRTPGSELTPPATSASVLKVVFEGDAPATIEIHKASSATGAVYYARSTATKGWVSVSRTTVEPILADLPALLGVASAGAKAEPADGNKGGPIFGAGPQP